MYWDYPFVLSNKSTPQLLAYTLYIYHSDKPVITDININLD